MQHLNGNSASTGAAARPRSPPTAKSSNAAAPAAPRAPLRKTLPDLALLAPGDELYFAYGSNMSPAVLSGRRKVHPKASQPGIISGFTLSFRLKGLPYIEPGFGTIESSGPGDRDNVHGVVHLITHEEWEAIKKSEGVSNDSKRGYQVVHLPCQLYDDKRTVTVVTLQAAQDSLVNSRAGSHGGLGVSGAVKPSGRYLRIIQEGALHHGLTKEYLDWLQRIQAYDSANVASRLGQVAIASTVGFGLSLTVLGILTERVLWGRTPAAAPAAPSTSEQQPGSEGTAGTSLPSSSSTPSSSVSRTFIGKAAPVVFPLVWFAHDRLLAPFLGKGM